MLLYRLFTLTPQQGADGAMHETRAEQTFDMINLTQEQLLFRAQNDPLIDQQMINAVISYGKRLGFFCAMNMLSEAVLSDDPQDSVKIDGKTYVSEDVMYASIFYGYYGSYSTDQQKRDGTPKHMMAQYEEITARRKKATSKRRRRARTTANSPQ